MSSASSETFISSYSFWMTFFFFLSYLIAESRTCNTVLHKSGKSGYPCLIPEFRVRHSAFQY